MEHKTIKELVEDFIQETNSNWEYTDYFLPLLFTLEGQTFSFRLQKFIENCITLERLKEEQKYVQTKHEKGIKLTADTHLYYKEKRGIVFDEDAYKRACCLIINGMNMTQLSSLFKLSQELNDDRFSPNFKVITYRASIITKTIKEDGESN